MVWTDSITLKIKTAIALVLVLLIVLGINMMYTKHFSELQESYTSVYEDRLLAEHYLFQISSLLHDKKQLVDQSKELNTADYHALDDAIHEVLQKYALTKLTGQEALHFTSMKAHLEALKSMEIHTMYATDVEQNAVKSRMNVTLGAISNELTNLADLQIVEAQSLIRSSDNIVANSNLASRLQIGLLISIGLLLQIVIFAYQSDKIRFAN